MRSWLGAAVILVAATETFATETLATTEVQERALRRAIAEADRGMRALEKGNTKRARESFDQALVALPGLPQGHLGLGHLAMRERRFEDALSEFRAAEEGYKGMSSLTVQMSADRYARSRDELQRLRAELTQLDGSVRQSQTRITENGPSEGELQRQRSQVRARIQALEGMNPPSSNAVREAPAEILFLEGNALFNLKRIPEAVAMWEEALERDARQPLVENNLAVAYWMTGRLDEARTAMERAEALGFKVNPNFRADLEKAIAARH